MVSNPVETVLTSVEGTKNILYLAKEKQCKSVIYVSSMEMYGKLESKNVTEMELGYINPLAVRSNYPESKRLCENMCVAFYVEYGVPVKIANGTIEVQFDIPQDNRFGYAADTKMKLNSDKLQKLGWEPKVGLEEMYYRMIQSMKATNS